MDGDKLPSPTGWRILVKLPPVREKKGSILVPTDMARKEQVASIIARIVKIGPLAYRDEKRFPNGPWCKEGDWVLLNSYEGLRMQHQDGEDYRIINDDTVMAVIPDPSVLERAP